MNKSKVGSLYTYYFDSINDLSKYIQENTCLLERYSYLDDVETRNKSERHIKWAGGLTFEESMDRLINGDEQLANEIEDVKIDEVEVDKISLKYVNDVQGVIPHVPNYVLGLPQSMINVTRNRVKTNNKIINIILDVSVSCIVSKQQYIRVSKLFLNVIDKIESMGYRCNIYYQAISANYSYYNLYLLKLKSSNEPFNKYKCSFVLGSLSMFRQIIFRLIEMSERNEIKNGASYGTVPERCYLDTLTEKSLNANNIGISNYKIFSIYNYIDSDEKEMINHIIK